MHAQRHFLLFIALAAAFATPAWGQIATSGGPVSGVTNGATSIPEIPDFSHVWLHPAFPWFEPPASGPGPVTNKSRWPQLPGDASGSLALPPLPPGVAGVSDYDQLVGDYTNPILQPWAAEVVKKFGEMSIAGIVYGNPSNQCWPMPMPFIYKQFTVQIIQQPDRVLIIYTNPSTDVRRVRLNDRHPEPLTPSWYGDSVGHYEGDTLVIDTVGFNDKTFVDNFRTPHSEKLHMVERIRLVEDGNFLEADIIIEDPAVFIRPLQVTKRSRRVEASIIEWRCAAGEMGNPFADASDPIPVAAKAEF